jgi:ABC-type iron transport system FetAB ATPase subunit
MLPAESAWWSDTVRDHFETPGETEVERLGFGVEVMDWTVSRLSTGERQRLALLRLLGIAPRALLLDEPTANLDPDSTRRVELLLSDYMARHEACSLWVTHDPEQVSRVSARHFVLSGGGLRKARGPVGEGIASWA